MIKSIPVTASGLAQFRKEKAELLEKRVPAVFNLKTAREMGDLSENAAYKVARMELSAIDARLRKLEYIIRLSTIVDNKIKDRVGFDTKIKLVGEGKEMVFTLVGGYESDPTKGRISHMSPIGRAVFNRKVGDEIRVNTPGGISTYRISEILE